VAWPGFQNWGHTGDVGRRADAGWGFWGGTAQRILWPCLSTVGGASSCPHRGYATALHIFADCLLFCSISQCQQHTSAGRRLLLIAIRSCVYTAASLTVAVAVIDPRHSRAKTAARPVAEIERRQMVVNRRFSERVAGRWT